MRLQQRECFFFTFTENRTKNLTTLWIAPAIPITFEFEGAAPATLNKKWILELIRSSYRPYGLTLIPEDEARLHES
jgi:hypothetical protein